MWYLAIVDGQQLYLTNRYAIKYQYLLCRFRSVSKQRKTEDVVENLQSTETIQEILLQR